MTPGILLMFVLALSGIGFAVGRQRALSVAGGDARRLHSRPSYHGAAVLMFTAIPAVILLLAWVFLRPLLAPGASAVAAPAAVAIAALAGLALSALRIRIDLRARNIV